MIKKINDLEFELFLTREKIMERVNTLGKQITKDFQSKELLVIGVLTGASVFTVDLIREIDISLEVEFVKLSSYQGLKSSGKVKIEIPLASAIAGRNVLIIEDIVDTGVTMDFLKNEISKHSPDSISIATLLHKPEAFQFNYHLNYVGFEIPNKFVVGYGLDYDGKGRNFPAIYQLSTP